MVDFSLELFPPRTPGAYYNLNEAVEELAALNPAFMTVTCGAGGSQPQSNCEKTQQLVLDLAKRYPFPIKAHVTCAGASRTEIDALADSYWQAGVTHLVALRGDMPNQEGKYMPHPEGYAYALDLIKGLKARHAFDITVSAYAEGHPEAPSLDFDLAYLKRKIDAGADRAITQFFFDPELFLRFRDRVIKKGINAPLIPGILPILNFEKLRGFARRCGAPIPNFLTTMFEGVPPESLDSRLLAMNVLSHQITRLIEEGVDFFHFYTLNETVLTKHVCKWLRAGF